MPTTWINRWFLFARPRLLPVGALLLLACTKEEPPGRQATPDESVAIYALREDLPTCNPSRLGQVFYVTSDKRFFYCDGRTLNPIDLSGDPNAGTAPWLVVLGNAGAECPNGGASIAVGPDGNRNGTLEDSEVASRVSICNGADGDPGPQGPPGERGPIGETGAQGWQGIQGNPGEDGTDGHNSLVETDDEPPGDNCAAGGVRIRSGVDTNDDGSLSTAETRQVRYVCNGVGGGGTGGAGGMSGGAGGGGIAGMAGSGGAGSGGVAGVGGGGSGGSSTCGVVSDPGSGELGDQVGTLELYGTFQSMGAIVTIPAGSDANGNAVAHVEYRKVGATTFRTGFPLTRTAPDRFVGSLFWLEPNSEYEVRVWFSDDSAALDRGWAMERGSTRAEISLPSPLHQFHVSPSGTGTDCSLEAPCSLTEGVNRAMPGDEVRLGPGTYYEGEFALPRSGTEGAPIVFRGTPNTTILDGADPSNRSWTEQGNGVFSTTLPFVTELVTAGGAELYPYTSLANLTALSAHGVPGWYLNGTTLYVHLANGANPSGVSMRMSRFEQAFFVNRDHIAFVDLTFRHYGSTTFARAIYLRDGSDNLIQGCRFVSNVYGVALKFLSGRNVIQDNEFSNTKFEWFWEDTRDRQSGGIFFFSPVHGRGNVIRRNVFHDDVDGLSACSSGSSAVTDETDVYENVGYALGDDGISADGRCANVRIWGNTLRDVLTGISIAPVDGGPTYAVRNVIYRTGAGNSDANYTGNSFKFRPTDSLRAIYLMHNTADTSFRPNSIGLSLISTIGWELVFSRNNAWVGADYGIDSDGDWPVDLDYDLLWGQRFLARWRESTTTHRFSTVSDLFATTGQEAHGVAGPPGFTAPDGGDFTPLASSPLVDQGMYIPGISGDFAGCGPDIGAIERE